MYVKPSPYEESPFLDAIGQETPALRSFANIHAARMDTTYQFGASHTERLLTYLRPDDRFIEIRKRMAKIGYLLGREHVFPNQDPRHVHFIIPMLAKPTRYDAPFQEETSNTYGDKSLFFEFGTMLGKLALASDENPMIIERALGLNATVLDFVRKQDDQEKQQNRLHLVPGFEVNLREVADDDVAVGFYQDKLAKEFGTRFDVNAADDFEAGFRGHIRSQTG